MAILENLDVLHRLLTGVPGWEDVPRETLEPLATTGLAHDHIRIRGRGHLLRVPRFSQFGFDARANHLYQTTCFARTAPSGRSPALTATIEPSDELPMGAFIVEEIRGRRPSLPHDMPSIAECLARVHALEMPAPGDRPPLADYADPAGQMLKLIERQVNWLDAADMPPMSQEQVRKELDWARSFVARVQEHQRPQPRSLVLTDTHPGNFLIQPSGRAIAVDLEKALYGSPAVDVAHASLYTSTTWDPEIGHALAMDEIAAFYRHYLNALRNCGAHSLAQQIKPWLLPMRRLTWLRTTSWFARWTAELSPRSSDGSPRQPAGHISSQTSASEEGGQSSSLSAASDAPRRDRGGPTLESTDPAVLAHARERIRASFNPRVIAIIRMEWLGPNGLKDQF